MFVRGGKYFQPATVPGILPPLLPVILQASKLNIGNAFTTCLTLFNLMIQRAGGRILKNMLV